MDKIDEKILLELLKNSRISITQLAKKINISRDIANYRISKLNEEGIIKDFITEIDFKKLKHISALLFVTIKASSEEKFIEYINSLNFVSWSELQTGKWSLGMSLYGRDIEEIELGYEEITNKFKENILDQEFQFYKSSNFFYEKYFNARTEEIKIFETKYVLDSIDLKILKLLSKNSRVSSVEISNEVNLSAAAIAQRIKNLEKTNYILKYTIYINAHKINLFQFYFFIKNKDKTERKEMLKYLKVHKNIFTIIEYVGDPFLEFGVFIDDPFNLRKVIQEIREKFLGFEHVEFIFTQKDVISFGLPNCVFNN